LAGKGKQVSAKRQAGKGSKEMQAGAGKQVGRGMKQGAKVAGKRRPRDWQVSRVEKQRDSHAADAGSRQAGKCLGGSIKY
jgi:hypothetical protein